MCVSVSEGVQGAHLKTVLLDFCQSGPVDPDFLCQEQSLNPYGSFEPKTNFLDLSVQKLRVLLDLMYSPFLFSFIVLEILLLFACAILKRQMVFTYTGQS